MTQPVTVMSTVVLDSLRVHEARRLAPHFDGLTRWCNMVLDTSRVLIVGFSLQDILGLAVPMQVGCDVQVT